MLAVEFRDIRRMFFWGRRVLVERGFWKEESSVGREVFREGNSSGLGVF